MGKNPAFQFYPNDWSRDLEEHSLEIEGAWIRICCKLWWSPTRGKLTRNLCQWAKILRVEQTDAERIIEYIKTWQIGDISRNGNGEVTVSSRRMERDEKDRDSNAIRQRRHKEKSKVNAPSNAPVTARSRRSSSSSSSSSPTSVDKIKYLDSIYLTIEQHAKLVSKYGQADTDRAIEIINTYVMSKGATYKSHYHAIMGWPMDRVKGEKDGRPGSGNSGKVIAKTGPARSDGNEYPVDAEY